MVLIYAGSILMIFNMANYMGFVRGIEGHYSEDKQNKILHIPTLLMVLFFAGYIGIAISGGYDWLITLILFGGSVFVFIIVMVLRFIMNRLNEIDKIMEIEYEELRGNLTSLTKDSLSVFRINLTRDEIESFDGDDLYDSDKTAASYSEMMSERFKYLLTNLDDDTDKGIFTREGMLGMFGNGHTHISEVVLCKRQDGRICFVELQAIMAMKPSNRDVVAYLAEKEHNNEVVNEAILHQVLGEQYDAVISIINKKYTVITGATEENLSRKLLPSSRTGRYDDFVENDVLPYLHSNEEGKEIKRKKLSAETIKKNLETNKSDIVDMSFMKEDGIHYKRFQYYKANDKAGLFILLISDMTDLVLDQIRINEQLTTALNHAEHANAAKSNFLSNMSHDMRTPMNAVTGYTYLAKNSEDLEQIYEYLEKIETSGNQLLSQIDDVLEMSRIESGKMEIEEAPTDVEIMMQEVRDTFIVQMQAKKIDYIVSTADITERVVLCDRNRMNSIWMNLISNAYKFTPERGTIEVELKQTGDPENDRVPFMLSVKDTGIGMSEDFKDKVFEMFERERSQFKSGVQGTGLGMAITKRIVEMMGGRIELESEIGKGTQIYIYLSFDLPRKALEASRSEPDEIRGYDKDFTGKKLLLAEDNPINQEIASLILKEAGFEIDIAETGREAFDMVKDSEAGYYDAVLMDIQMPELNGYEATKKIRDLEDPALSSIPIIAMTANVFQEDLQRAQDSGMNSHITKPIDIEKMMATIAEVLQ